MFSTTTALSTMLAVAPMVANAHMIMKSPAPYGTPSNGPLEPNGSNYPCKGPPYTATTMNNWAVGSTQKLEFVVGGGVGTAVHGGGSCQISVTTDREPTKASKFKVIHSFIGACPPPPDGGGNYVAGTQPTLTPLPFQVPSELPNGVMTVAWTWQNRMGNREFYMNCGGVTVTGGANDTTAFDALPDMAIANVAVNGNTCATLENFDYKYENPGRYVTKSGKGPFGPLCGTGSAGTGSTGASAQPQSPAAAPAAPAPPVVPAPSTLQTVVTMTAPTGPAPTPNGGSAVSDSAPAAAPPAGGAGTCSPDGAIVCSPDGMKFGLCIVGEAVMQAVAAGTKCTGGKIAKRGADIYSQHNQRTAV
jgi:hypothetical protein